MKSFYLKPICLDCGTVITMKLGTALLVCMGCSRQYRLVKKNMENFKEYDLSACFNGNEK